MVNVVRNLILSAVYLAMTNVAAFAQETTPVPAVLVADDVSLSSQRVLTATGNVEAFQGTTRLTARQIIFDQSSGQLTVVGPITIQDGADVVILADQAELSRDLQNGLLTGARMVLNQQLQLASVEMNRVNGRFTQLYKTAVTSCDVCDDGRPPLWQIRAKQVVHDQAEQQLYFDKAQLRIRNTPVFYFPRLRLPDPTLKRATGFLIPSLATTSQLATGLKIPYFIKIGDHRDLTLTPYLSSRTTTMEFRYRQAFSKGNISFEGAITRDELREGETRGYLFGTGSFDLNRGYVLDFDIEATSDDAYLSEYGYSDKDRLDSQIAISRTRRDKYVQLSYVNYKTLRDGEDNETLPTNVFDATYERRLFPVAIGGEFRLSGYAHSHFRDSNEPTDANGDGIVDGRDVLRLNIEADWIKQWTFSSGLLLETQIGFAADAFQINEDDTYPDTDSAFSPRTAITLRYPMVRQTARSRQVLEPVLQVAYVGGNDLDIPIEENTLVEFDEGNLLSLSHFSSPDRRDRGRSVAVGGQWTRFGNNGWDTKLSFGQIFRNDSDDDFTDTSGLSGTASDFLLAGQIRSDNGLSIIGRTLFDENLIIAKAEVRGDWIGKKAQIGTSYIWLTADADEDRATPVSEVTFDGSYAINSNWTANADWRYDIEDSRAVSAGVGFEYNNECVSVDLTIDRSYTSSTSIEPSTSLGFTVSLRGFSANNGSTNYERSCKNRTN
ncbi:LPS assembly protein LptD [Pseudosulfitobacter sp. SM2401]|uniref:LPS-assembly protein LptD n=1 Tax=Pseudosulfitobacter sp. SM2401 TaxID=3350098 RepID=UPI0036F1DBF7